MLKKILLSALVFLVCTGAAFAQSGSLTGTITDAETGETLPGANILLVELSRGAATDIDGNYKIADIPSGTYTLRITYVGYQSSQQSVEIGSGQTEVNAQLQPDLSGLEEVVVTGIASSTSKAASEVSVSRVSADEYTATNTYQDVSQLLGGKVSGVKINASSGNAASGVRFDIRSGGGLNGDGQPVIYIDGVRVDNSEVGGFGVGGQGTSSLAGLNPEDIASIDILKGPAGAALYGTSGSNGVVLITTKKGNVGAASGMNVRYKTTVGYNEQSYEYTEEDALSYEDANAIFRQGNIQQHSLSASGGNEFIRYFTSFDLRGEEGIIRNNKLDRNAFRANFDVFPSDKVTLSVSTQYSMTESARPQNDNNIFGYLGNTLLFSNSYLFTDSTAIENLQNTVDSERFIGSVQASYVPVENLEVRASIGFDGDNLRNDELKPVGFTYGSVTGFGERSFYTRENRQTTYDINARYSYNLTDDLQATSIVGSQMFDRRLQTAFFQKQNFPSSLITNIGAGTDFQQGDESFLHTRELGVFGQQEFSYDDTYTLSLGLRRDFAAAIGSEAPSIYYPKASFAIQLHKLGVVPSAFNFFKVRAAYGETGVLPGLNDSRVLLWEAAGSGYGRGAVLDFIGNPEIKPERVKELEFGVDLEFMNDYSLELTYYRQQADDSIIDFNNAPSTGKTASAVPFNVGGVKGWGIESAFRATPIRNNTFQLDLGIMANYSDNEVTDLGGAQPIFDAFDLNVIKEGLTRSAFYVPKVNGALFNENGEYAGVDVDSERSFAGRVVPEYNGSFDVTARYKNFSVYVLAEWTKNVQVFNNTKLFGAIFGNYKKRNDLAEQLDELTPGTAEYEEAAHAYAQTDPNHDYNYIEDADYFKLSEISFAYDLTSLVRNQLSADFLKSLRLSVSGRNLWMSTLYSGADPTVNFRGARDLSRNQDFLTLQTPRVYNFTLSLGL